ncbi:hypothetical protein PtA15_2A796 [Puccinia triticina]|uniref:Uncharacterized protein n=1 Tax=Puccinia triticina TaxID=208348 RepID=A0ABY7CCR3_9BASI|nr:uncharacterized protein PtA15_2A796 [Puccinia triticina]WAQ82479.1 hypothetical protein PtA15_2A796 [Puccinia triticina]
MCIAGITPGPYSPDPHSFNHLLTSIADELITLDAGIVIPTYKFPAGRFVHIKLLCVYGDVLATKKVVGYASHLATKFCSFCHALQSNISQLQLSARREKAETIHSASNSKNAKSKTAQEEILKKTGVRWSELNQLVYWDPSRHLVLGVMHNWLEATQSSKRAKMDTVELAMWIDNKDVSDESEDDEDISLDGGLGGTFFSADDINTFRTGMSHVCCVRLFARRFKSGDIKQFEIHYKKYLDSVGGLFEGVKVQPNHHFSLHIPQQMASWGPLAGVAEFPGERLIGFLQKINTNNKIDEMHQSMITRGCRLQRMMADPDYTQLTKVKDKQKTEPVRQKKPIRLLSSRYELLYNMVLSYDTSVVDRKTFPVPQGRWILSGNVKAVQSLTYNGVTFGSMAPCNCVVVKVGGQIKYYLVRQCYKYPHKGGEMKEFMVVSPIMNRYPKATNAIPTRPFRYLLFLFGMVVGTVQDREEVVVPSHVVSLAAYQLLEKGTFSIDQNRIALIPHGYDTHLNISGSE